MMKTIVRYYEEASKLIRRGKIHFALLKHQTSKQLAKVKNMKFENPNTSSQEITGTFNKLAEEISIAFREIAEK